MPGDSDGAGPREDVLLALSDVVRHQTPALCRHHSQGGKAVAFFFSLHFLVVGINCSHLSFTLMPEFESIQVSCVTSSSADCYIFLHFIESN